MRSYKTDRKWQKEPMTIAWPVVPIMMDCISAMVWHNLICWLPALMPWCLMQMAKQEMPLTWVPVLLVPATWPSTVRKAKPFLFQIRIMTTRVWQIFAAAMFSWTATMLWDRPVKFVWLQTPCWIWTVTARPQVSLTVQLIPYWTSMAVTWHWQPVVCLPVFSLAVVRWMSVVVCSILRGPTVLLLPAPQLQKTLLSGWMMFPDWEPVTSVTPGHCLLLMPPVRWAIIWAVPVQYPCSAVIHSFLEITVVIQGCLLWMRVLNWLHQQQRTWAPHP